MTAREIELSVKRLRDDQDPWEHTLDNGAVVHVRRAHSSWVRFMPQRPFGRWYLVWVSKPSPRHLWSSRKLTAMTPKTASKKARSLITKYGTAQIPWNVP